MDLISLIIIVAVLVIGCLVIWYLISQLPLDPMVQKIITIVMVVLVGVVAIILLLKAGGMGGSIRVGALGPLIGLLA